MIEMTKMTREFALFRNNFLPISETFIHDELRFHTRYKGSVFCRSLLNHNLFPGHEVFNMSDSRLGRYSLQSLLYGACGHSGAFIKIFEQRNFKLIHAHFGHNGINAIPYSRRFNLPLIVSMHGRDIALLIGRNKFPPAWMHYTLRKRDLFENATLFLAASEELKWLLAEAGCPENKIAVHRLGIDLTLFRPSDSPEEVPSVLMVGRLVKKKGFCYGLKAFHKALCMGSRARLIIIGQGPEKRRLLSLCSSLGITDLVTFCWARPRPFVIDAMARSAVVLTPSVVAPDQDRDSGLMVAKEAQASAVPVIGHYHGGLPEIIDDGYTGYLVNEKDTNVMAERLFFLLKDRELRNKMGYNGRAKMEKEYNIIHTNLQLEKIYDNVCH